MSVSNVAAVNGPWWREPTKDQWYAYLAAWMGWTLDAFDFAIFLLIRHCRGLCLSSGRPLGWLVTPVLVYFAMDLKMGFALPMMVATIGWLVVLVIAVFLGPETRGKVMTADLEVTKTKMA